MRRELVEVDISVDLYILIIVNVVILIGINRHQHRSYVGLQQIQDGKHITVNHLIVSVSLVKELNAQRY